MIVGMLVAAGWLFVIILKFVICLLLVVFVATVLTVLILLFNEVAEVVDMSQDPGAIIVCIWVFMIIVILCTILFNVCNHYLFLM